jgi:hypothetical protein
MDTEGPDLGDGLWYRVGAPYIHICCDCGLAHDVEFKMDSGELYHKWTRNEPESELARKTTKFDFVARRRRKKVV